MARPTTDGARRETLVERMTQRVPAASRPRYGRKKAKNAERSFTREV
jgi:hypothetical protein